MLSRSRRKWAIWDFSFSVRAVGLGIWKAWCDVSGVPEGGSRGAEYRVERRRLGLVEIELGVPGEVYPADSVEVALAFFFDAGTLSCSRSSGHVVEALLPIFGA